MRRLSQSRCLYWGAITIVHHCVLPGPSHGRVQGNKPQLTVTSPPFFCQDRPHWYSKPSLSLTKSGFFSSFLEYAIENLFRQTISQQKSISHKILQNECGVSSFFILDQRVLRISIVISPICEFYLRNVTKWDHDLVPSSNGNTEKAAPSVSPVSILLSYLK